MPTQFWNDASARSADHGGSALPRAFFVLRRRFEPKISLIATFLAKRLLSLAIFSIFEAEIIQFLIGSSQAFCFCLKRVVCSSSDFFSLINFAFSIR
ncbi:MAG: hypothetical protein A3J67_05365 [Parcubacteria group bacterium RIFCSPHIGHO2_02_FULL_48_10b]|nr:MAG: hypothetical protein A3J67_05365 [Parcubacteria group bacterium RIFCSPHIGHO2_02_FULL_48_10b]